MKLNDREKKLALATGIAFVLVVLYIGTGLFSDDSASSISNTTAAHFDDLFSKIDSVEAQKTKNGVYRKNLENDTAQFLTEKEKNNLWTEIEQVAQQSGMQLKGISPSLNMRARPLPKIDFTITAECQFEQAVQFLDKVRKAKYFIQPTSMKLSLKDKNQPVLSLQMTLTSYLLDNPPASSTSTSSIARGGE